MKKIEPKEIDKNVIRLIGEDWMLVAAGNREKFNMMTASWGSMGYLWNKPVVMVFRASATLHVRVLGEAEWVHVIIF